jgi:hypothetical protein
MEASASFCETGEPVGHVFGRGVGVMCLLLLASAVMSKVCFAADLRVTAQESTILGTTFDSGSVVLHPRPTQPPSRTASSTGQAPHC